MRVERTIALLQSAALPFGYAVIMRAVGIEPTSYWLRVNCSAI